MVEQKKGNMRDYILYDSIYMKIKTGETHPVTEVLSRRRQVETWRRDGDILYLDLGNGYTSAYIWKNSILHVLGFVLFFFIKKLTQFPNITTLEKIKMILSFTYCLV